MAPGEMVKISTVTVYAIVKDWSDITPCLSQDLSLIMCASLEHWFRLIEFHITRVCN